MESLDIQRSSSGFYSEADVSLKKRVRRIVVTGIGLIMFQQLCGANMMIFRAEEVFDGLNPVDDAPVRAPIYAIVLSATQVSMAFSRPMPSPPEYGIYTRYRNTWLIVSTRAQVLLCSISVELVEILGRKFMLITSGVGMSLCLLALIVHYALHTKDCFEFSEPDWHKYIPVILVALYTCSYSIGWGSVVILVYTEIIYFDKWFSSLIYACGQFVMFLLVYTFFNTNILRGNTYALWMYTATCIVSVAFVWCCVPETRALRLNRIQATFDDERKRYDRSTQQAKVEE
uniref:Facilitated trehalose transporter Tret1-2 n=1 Tax=Sipha flava TaxID=143950 RepID=A0A2S2QKV5_9HEMI